MLVGRVVHNHHECGLRAVNEVKKYHCVVSPSSLCVAISETHIYRIRLGPRCNKHFVRQRKWGPHGARTVGRTTGIFFRVQSAYYAVVNLRCAGYVVSMLRHVVEQQTRLRCIGECAA